LATNYTFSLADRLASVAYPSGALVTYARDNVGRILAVTYAPSPTGRGTTFVTNSTYLPFGPLNAVTFKNGRTLTKTYDGDYAIDKVVRLERQWFGGGRVS